MSNKKAIKVIGLGIYQDYTFRITEILPTGAFIIAFRDLVSGARHHHERYAPELFDKVILDLTPIEKVFWAFK